MIEKIENEIKNNYYISNYTNDGQRFVAWYLRNIYNLDENETKYCITDGPNDKQFDAIYIDEINSIIHIIQGKFYREKLIDAEPLREVLSSWIQLKNIVKLQENTNEKLRQKLSEVARGLEDDYDIEFELLIPSQLTESAQKDLKVFQEQLAKSDDFSATLSLINKDELERRYDVALGQENPNIVHTMTLELDKCISMNIGGVKVIMAAIPLKECINIPGIKDQTLFKKNVRQSLGISNPVNKGIKESIYEEPNNFFFYHNGITAICSKMELNDNKLTLKELNVVNGCQSLNTILSCSEKVKEENNAYVMFRFYEVPDRATGDKISTNTNSQSTVKARDLRSNDKRVLAMKKAYEQKYSNGQLMTKRGETRLPSKDEDYTIDLEALGKYLMTWHSQRPNIAYSPTKIFDKYFDQLFKKDYEPEKIMALNTLWKKVISKWTKANPLGLNESLLAMKAYAPYHHLYAISLFFSVANGVPGEVVINPVVALEKLQNSGSLENVVNMAGNCLNIALQTAASEPQTGNKVFSPQNWIKAKKSLTDIRSSVSLTLNAMKMLPGGIDTYNKLMSDLKCDLSDFETRWTAD